MILNYKKVLAPSLLKFVERNWSEFRVQSKMHMDTIEEINLSCIKRCGFLNRGFVRVGSTVRAFVCIPVQMGYLSYYLSLRMDELK